MSFFSGKSETHATTLLKQDHDAVDSLFDEFSRAQDGVGRARLASQICQSLSIHAEIEERLLYPRALVALDRTDDQLVREATVEHGTLKGLISRIGATPVGDPMFDAHMKVLKEYVQHHVREEEREMFPKLEHSGLDLEAIGLDLLQLKQRLQARVDMSGVPARGTVRVVDVSKPERAARAAA